MNVTPSKIKKIDLTVACAIAEPLDCLDGKPADVESGQALSAVPSSPAAGGISLKTSMTSLRGFVARVRGFAGFNAAGQRGSGAGNAPPMNRLPKTHYKEDPTHGKS